MVLPLARFVANAAPDVIRAEIGLAAHNHPSGVAEPSRADELIPERLRDALEATNGLVGVTGEFKMSKTDHLGIDDRSLYMVDIKGGGWSVKP